jgi:flagellar assembly protein FliH
MSYKARRVADGNATTVEPFAWEPTATRPVQALPDSDYTTRPRSAADPIDTASVERDAFAKGYAQGERAGIEAAATRADGMLRRLAQTIEELAALRSEMIHRTERQAVQLVLAIAERVVQREVTLDRGLLLGMARVALDRLGEYGSATIRLHPDDYQAIGAKPSIEGAPVQVVMDATVSRGGCHVQSDFGFMDVSPESQFRELARALLSEAAAPQVEADTTHAIVLK